MQFICRLGTPEGQIIEEVLEASDERALKKELSSQGYHLFEIRRRGVTGWLRLPSIAGRSQRIKPRELLIFNQELAALLRSGLPMLQALELMHTRQRDPVFRQILEQVHDRVKSGEDLSTAVAELAKKIVPVVPEGLTVEVASGVGSAAPFEPLLGSWIRKYPFDRMVPERAPTPVAFPVLAAARY